MACLSNLPKTDDPPGQESYSITFKTFFLEFVEGGCYEDNNPQRLLKGNHTFYLRDNCPEACNAFCQGFKYFAVEAANECFCGDTLSTPLVKKPQGHCNSKCPGDKSKKCGGWWRRLNLFQTTPVGESVTPVPSICIIALSGRIFPWDGCVIKI